MKIKRYPYGQTNIGQIASAKGALVSPREAAFYAMAPYQAAAEAVDRIGGVAETIMQKQMEVQDENDKMLASSDLAMVSANLKSLRKQADVEKWTDEQFKQKANEEIKNFVSGVEKISPRNRKKTAFYYSGQAQRLIAESDLEALDIRTDRSKEAFMAAFDRLGADEDYEGQLSMLEIAESGDGMKLFDEETIQKNRRIVEGNITAKNMMFEYEAARKVGIEDEYLGSLVGKDISDEAMQAFAVRKKEYDALTQKVESDLKMEKGIKIALMTQSITATTTDDALVQAFRDLELTDYGILNMWFNRRESEKNGSEALNVDFLDPYSTKHRKLLDGAVMAAGETIPERFNAALSLSVERRIAPEWLDGYFNSNAYNAKTFADAAENWIRYHDSADSVPLGVDSDVIERYEKYRRLRKGMDSQEAAGNVQTYYAGLTSDTVKANQAQWSEPVYGDGDKTPAELIFGRVEGLLKDANDSALAVQGFFSNDVPQMPVEMRDFINTLSQIKYGNSANIEDAANTIFRSIQSSGWAVTTANDGVKSGEIELGPQWMKKPPPRNQERTRNELHDDVAGKTYFVNGRQITIDDPENVEIWNYNKAPDGSDAWRLRYNGEVLYTLSGAPALFQYAKPTENAPQPITDEAVNIIDKAKQAKEEQQRRLEQEQKAVRDMLMAKGPDF